MGEHQQPWIESETPVATTTSPLPLKYHWMKWTPPRRPRVKLGRLSVRLLILRKAMATQSDMTSMKLLPTIVQRAPENRRGIWTNMCEQREE